MSRHGHPDLGARFADAMQAVQQAARGGETTTGWISAEVSDFVRFNRGRVRQAGTVEKASIELRLIHEGRQARFTQTLSGIASDDCARIAAAFDELRGIVGDSEPDPHLAVSDRAVCRSTRLASRLPDAAEVCEVVCTAAGEADLVGFYAGGPLACGFASSLGHSMWHESRPWFLDYCLCSGGDKAVKVTFAEPDWHAEAVAASIARARRDAAVLQRPPKILAPGDYRAWLSPAALAELIGMMNWGGFSASALMSGHSPLARLKSDADRFSERVRLSDDLAAGGLPRFQSDGFERPACLKLIEAGRFAATLVSPRSAREFALTGTGAISHEAALAPSLAGGELADENALAALGTGVAVSNFWYLNWSDRSAGRLTGMTRFASVWVEDGEPVAPLAVMRFDDSLFRLLGTQLEALGRAVHRIPDTQTYDSRSFGVTMVPGALLAGLNFTL